MSKLQTTPSGWKLTTLGTFMEFKNGVNADKNAYGSGTEFVNVMDIFKRNFMKKCNILGKVEITEKQKAEYSVKYGDILFNRTSEVPDEIAFSSVYLDEAEITFGGFVIRGRQKKELLDPLFAGYCFNNSSIRREMIRRSQGVVRANIGQKDLNKVPILIPPKDEQKKIASVLALWDNAIEKTEALIAAKEKQFEWLCNELIALSDKETYLSELCTIKTGKKDVNEGATNGKYPFFTCAKEPMLSNSYSFDTTAILIAGNGNIGNPRLYSGKFEAYQRTYVLFDFKNVDPRFLIFFLRLKLQKKIDKERQQGAMPYIKLNTLARFEVSLPELEVQKKVADQLDTAQLEIKLTRKLLQQYRSQKRGLMQKLLTGEWQVSSARSAAEGALQSFSKESVA